MDTTKSDAQMCLLILFIGTKAIYMVIDSKIDQSVHLQALLKLFC